MCYDPLPPDLPMPRVLKGKDGWVFLCDDANGNLDQLLGTLRFTDSDLRDYREILQTRHERLAALGIPYVFAIAPSKEAIHPEQLPETTPAVGPPDTARQLIEALAGSPVQAVDLHAPLRELVQSGQELYYRRDAHWNYDGALVASRTLLDAIRHIGLEVQPPSGGELTWEEEQFEGDLSNKPAVALVNGQLQAIVPHEPEQAVEVSRRPGLGSLGLRGISTPTHLEVSDTRPSVVVENRLKPRAPRAIVYRDSSARWLVPYVGSAFSWSAWLWKATIDLALIERERPDLVLHVVTERFLPRVPYGDIF
jgi:hypothetical protein